MRDRYNGNIQQTLPDTGPDHTPRDGATHPQCTETIAPPVN